MKTQNATLRGLVGAYKKHAPKNPIVRHYTNELFGALIESYEYERAHRNTPFYKWYKNNVVANGGLRKKLLNGARNWSEYSWNGCSLVYNWDIAEVVLQSKTARKTFGFNPERGELKRTEITRYGREIHLLDIQAEYLQRAYYAVSNIVNN